MILFRESNGIKFRVHCQHPDLSIETITAINKLVDVVVKKTSMTNTEKAKEGLDKPPRYTYEDVIDEIKASDKIADPDKTVALNDLDNLIKAKAVNVLESKYFDSVNIGTKLEQLFNFNASELGSDFWGKINSSLNEK